MIRKDNYIEKAKHNVGDTHPNGKWVWTEYKTGKFSWRNRKENKKEGEKKTPTPMKSNDLYDWAKKTSEENLLKVAGSENGNAQMRMIAYKELKSRNFDMSKINTSGTLDSMMKLTGNKETSKEDNTTSTDENTNVDIDDDSDEESNKDGEITEKWYLDRNDERVKKIFNLKTKEGRIKYDNFVYKMKKKEKDYKSPVEVVQDLNEQYLEFLDNPEQRFMISAGGAGIGKSYGFNKMAELLNMSPYEEGDEPGEDTYDMFEAPDVNSGKQLLNILKAHNGKIIVFDDNDKVLRRADCASVMKKATASTGKRILEDPEDIKSNFEFTGRIIIMTNKDLSALSDNEDTKAIISRAMMVSEIYMTVPETIEVMKSRFQDYEFKSAPRIEDKEEDKKERDDIMKLIEKNKKNIDPSQFTTRTFQEILTNKRKVDKANEKRKDPSFAALIGDKQKDWKEVTLGILTKSYETNIEDINESEELLKAEDLLLEDTLEKAEFSTKERKNLANKKEAMPDGSYPIRNVSDLKNAIRAFGRTGSNKSQTKSWIKKRAKELGKEELLPETWKAQEIDIFNNIDMDIQKAEDLLLSE